MLQLEDKDYENLKKVVVDYIDQAYPDKHFTFKVDSRRADKNYPVRSEQMNCDFGEVILNAFPETSVDVHHPDVLVHVEIRKVVNIYSLMIPGPAVCRWAPTERQPCFCPAVSTARWQAI